MFVNEAFQLMVSDLSNYLNKTVTDVYKLDLMPIINRDIRGRSWSKEYHNWTDSSKHWFPLSIAFLFLTLKI